jgi:hypothetical protein
LAVAVVGRLETRAEVDGRPVSVAFDSVAETGRRARAIGLIGLAAGLVVFLMVAGIGGALGRRAQLDNQLANAEQKALVKLRGVSAKARLKAQNRRLQAWPDRGAPIGTVLADLAATGGSVALGARIEAVHWEHSFVAVEARGEAPPLTVFADQTLRRSAKPVRRNVWLWAVERTPIQGAVPAPVTAMPVSAGGQP